MKQGIEPGRSTPQDRRAQMESEVTRVGEGEPGSGILAPRGTPAEIISRINQAVNNALKNREVEERLLAVGAEAAGSTPAEFGAFLRKETARWEKVLRESGVRPQKRQPHREVAKDAR